MKIFLSIIFLFINLIILAPTGAESHQNRITIMILGDSLSAGYGLPTESSWVTLLKNRLQNESPNYHVINISISGETTLGGRNRIEQALKLHEPNIVIIGLGANDGLRGTSIQTINDNLEMIIETCQRNHAAPILVGMQLPPNYGSAYTQKFRDLYQHIATRYQLPLIPFLLEGFADKRDHFLADGIHPNTAAQALILENVWKVLNPLIKTQMQKEG
ncbi:MAG TPA: arylesterase [Nitrosomonas sp.]|nr:arylesterase [Nitrosomonas sp.]HNA69957.1 arylesterase [Nitrosomonas sp.]